MFNIFTNRKKIAEYHNAHAELAPFAAKFGFDPNSTITKRRIDERYVELRKQIMSNEPNDFSDLTNLDYTYSELLRLAQWRDRTLADLGGRIEFND